VAVIRSGRPDAEKILLGAHYDHMGRFKRDKGAAEAGVVLYGANDNASGVAAVAEIARLLAPYAAEFKRDLIVALFGAEEMGIVGSRRLERMLRDSSVVVGHMVNLEMLGRMRGDTLVLQGGATCRSDEVAESVPRPDSLFVHAADEFSVGSDHIAFARRMIPVSFFVTTDCSTLHRATDTPEPRHARHGEGRELHRGVPPSAARCRRPSAVGAETRVDLTRRSGAPMSVIYSMCRLAQGIIAAGGIFRVSK